LPLTSELRAYGWVNYADKSSRNYVNPERIVKANTQSPTATNGARVSETAVIGVYPNGYQPAMTYVSKDWAAVGGLKYVNDVLGDLDFAVSFGKNETGRYTDHTINPSWGTSSPTDFYLGSWKTRTTSATADYLKELPFAFLDSAVLSAGALYRKELWGTADMGDYIGYTSGPLGGQTMASLYGPGGIYNQYASQFPGVNFATDTSVIPATGSSTAGIQPIDAGSITRNVYGAYLGVDATVLQKLDIGLTGRYEHYSDFGSTSNYRVTARYEFVPAFAIRGTASSGFHAPSLAELGQQSTGYTGTFTNNGISIAAPGRTRQFRPNDPVGALFGAKPLDPEKSTTVSLGIVVRPDSTSSITVDAYQLQIDNVITNTDAVQNLTGLTNVTTVFNSVGLTGYTQASYYLNAWDTRTRGIDIVANKEFRFTTSTLDLLASTSFLDTRVSNVNNTVLVGAATTPNTVIGNARIRDAETGVPKNKVILDAKYTFNVWSVEATGTRYSSYRYNVGNVPGVATANGNIDQVFSPETYLDLGFGYAANKHLRFDLNVQNAFNKYPEKYVNGNRSSGINPYSFIAPNGASGRFVQLGGTYNFGR
jgi:iron complex outermembrane receptor protein